MEQVKDEYTRHVGGKELWKFILALFLCGMPVLCLGNSMVGRKDEQMSCLLWID